MHNQVAIKKIKIKIIIIIAIVIHIVIYSKKIVHKNKITKKWRKYRSFCLIVNL
jgi:hypothetical protein